MRQPQIGGALSRRPASVLRRERSTRVLIPGLGPADYLPHELDQVRAIVADTAGAERQAFPGRERPMTEGEHVAALIHEAKVYADAELIEVHE